MWISNDGALVPRSEKKNLGPRTRLSETAAPFGELAHEEQPAGAEAVAERVGEKPDGFPGRDLDLLLRPAAEPAADRRRVLERGGEPAPNVLE